jgi:transposase-like protein
MNQKLTFPELRERATALRLAGKSRREIKDILGIGSNETLNSAIRGVQPPAWTWRPRAKDELHARARELRAVERTCAEIAAELGVSKGSVSLWVRDRPREGRLSYAECRERNAEGVARYWAAERPARAARQQGIRDGAASEVRSLSDREILIAGRDRVLV